MDDADEEGEYLNDNNYDEFTGYGGSLFNKEDPYEDDDREADRIYGLIDRHLDERGKSLREKKRRLEVEKCEQERPKIQQQFVDLVEDLKNVSEAEWMSLPDVGDARNRKQRIARPDKFTPVPDSLLAHQAKIARGGETLVYIDPKEDKNMDAMPDNDDADSDVDDQSQALASTSKSNANLPVNIGEMSEFRSSYISMKLSSVSNAVEGQTANPQDYLTNLQSMVPNQIRDAAALKEYRKQFAALRHSNPTYPKAWIASVRLEEAAGKLKAARSLVLAACEQCPKSADIWFEAVRLHPKDISKALLIKALKENPRSVELWIKAADLESDEADKRRVFEKARSLIPKSAILWKKSVELEKPDEARRLLREAVEFCPESVELWSALAKLEPYEKAREVLIKASDKNPSDRSIWIMAAKLEEASGSESLIALIIKGAVEKLKERGVQIVRADWFREAIDAEAAGFYLTSRAIVQHMIGWSLGDIEEDKKKLLSVWLSDAKLFASKKAYKCARAVYETITDPKNDKKFNSLESVWLAWCDFERLYGTEKNLVDVIKTAVKSGNCTNSERLWLMLADHVRSNVEEARQILSDALEANPDSERIILAAVQLECDHHHEKVARRILADACMSAKTPRLVMRLAELERSQGNIDEAIRILKSGIEEYKNFPRFYLEAGHIEEERGQNEKAKDYYSMGLKFNPTSIQIWIDLACLEERTGFKARARSRLEMGRLRNPKNCQLWLESARFELRAHTSGSDKKVNTRPDVALGILAKGIRECKDQADVRILIEEQDLIKNKRV